MQRYDTLLFDADNTLFDFTGAARIAVRQALAYGGLEPTAAVVDRYEQINGALWERFNRGEVSREFLTVERYRILLPEYGLDPGRAEEINDHYLRQLGRESRLLPGAESMCRALADRCRLFIVTNGMSVTQVERMAQTPIRDVIGQVFVSQDMGCRKPQTVFFRRVFETLGLTPEQLQRTVIIGDEPASDIRGGQNAGIDTIWYNPKGRPVEPGLEPTWQAADFEAVRRIVLGEDL